MAAQLHPFLRAAAEGDIASLETQYHPVLVNTADPDGKTALHYAASENQAAAVEWLLAHGFPVDQRNKKGLTPLHYAMFKGHQTMAEGLAAKGADLFAVDASGRTAMHLAAVNGLTSMVEWLRSAGLSESTPSADGMQAVHFAALGGHVDLVEWLIGHGADVHAETHTGMTAMHLACMKGHLELAQRLAGHGVSPLLGDHRGRTPLHLASVGHHPSVVLWLLQAGASPKVADADGKTAPSLVAALLAGAGSSGAAASTSTSQLEAVRDMLAAALAPPSPPTTIVQFGTGDAASLIAHEYDAWRREQGVEEEAIAPSLPTLPLTLPPPGYGTTATTVCVKWEAPHRPPAAPPVLEYGLQHSTKWALGWTDAQCGVGHAREGTRLYTPATTITADDIVVTHTPTVPTPYACIVGLAPGTTYSIRVRARNENGWGPWATMAKGDEVTTLPAGAVPTPLASLLWGGGGVGTDVSSPSDSVSTVAASTGRAEADVGEVASTAVALVPVPPTHPPQPAFVPAILLPPALQAAVTSGDLPAVVQAFLSNGATSSADSGAAVEDGAHNKGGSSAETGSDGDGDGDGSMGAGGAESKLAWHNRCVHGVDAIHGRTALHHAAHAGHLPIVLWLMERGMALDAIDLMGATPLLLGVVAGHLHVVKALAFHGASINASDLKGYTALQYAALKGRLAVFRWLCEAGAGVEPRNSRGQSVRDICEGKHAAANKSGIRDDIVATGSMLGMLDNTLSPPLPPAVAQFVDATRYTLLVNVGPGKPLPGCPAPDALEVQYSGKLALFWSTAASDIVPAHDIYSPDYLPMPSTTATLSTAGLEAGEGMSKPATTSQAIALPCRNRTGTLVMITGLAPDTKYVVQARYHNARGWGQWSAKSADMGTRTATDRHQVDPNLVAVASTCVGCEGRLDSDTPPARWPCVDPVVVQAYTSPMTGLGEARQHMGPVPPGVAGMAGGAGTGGAGNGRLGGRPGRGGSIDRDALAAEEGRYPAPSPPMASDAAGGAGGADIFATPTPAPVPAPSPTSLPPTPAAPVVVLPALSEGALVEAALSLSALTSSPWWPTVFAPVHAFLAQPTPDSEGAVEALHRPAVAVTWSGDLVSPASAYASLALAAAATGHAAVLKHLLSPPPTLPAASSSSPIACLSHLQASASITAASLLTHACMAGDAEGCLFLAGAVWPGPAASSNTAAAVKLLSAPMDASRGTTAMHALALGGQWATVEAIEAAAAAAGTASSRTMASNAVATALTCADARGLTPLHLSAMADATGFLHAALARLRLPSKHALLAATPRHTSLFHSAVTCDAVQVVAMLVHRGHGPATDGDLLTTALAADAPGCTALALLRNAATAVDDVTAACTRLHSDRARSVAEAWQVGGGTHFAWPAVQAWMPANRKVVRIALGMPASLARVACLPVGQILPGVAPLAAAITATAPWSITVEGCIATSAAPLVPTAVAWAAASAGGSDAVIGTGSLRSCTVTGWIPMGGGNPVAVLEVPLTGGVPRDAQAKPTVWRVRWEHGHAAAQPDRIDFVMGGWME